MKLMNYYKEIFSALEKDDIKYLIVGGVAVNLYGYTRFTGDIDILLSLTEENLQKLDEVMKKLGYVERLPVSVFDLADQDKLNLYINEKNLKAYTYFSDQGLRLSLDIIVNESKEFDSFYDRSNVVEAWELELPVVALDDLIDMKKDAARDKDLLDLEALLKLKNNE